MFATPRRALRGPSAKYGLAALSHRDAICELSSHLSSVEGAHHIVSQLNSKKNVNKLVLGHTQLGDEGCDVLFDFLRSEKGRLHKVFEISLNSNSIGSRGLDAISAYLKDNTVLRELFLQNNSFTPDPAQVQRFVEAINSSSLEVLSLTSNRQLSDSFIKMFLPSLDARNLRELHLSAMDITHRSLRYITNYLSSGRRCHLHTFKCNGNSLGFRGVRAIINTVYQYNYNITELELHANEFAQGGRDEDAEDSDGDEPIQSWRDLQVVVHRLLARNQKHKREIAAQAVILLKYSRALLLCSNFNYISDDPITPPSDAETLSLVIPFESHNIRCNLFRALPVELQFYIMSFLAPILSPAQIARIYSFAASRETLPPLLPCLLLYSRSPSSPSFPADHAPGPTILRFSTSTAQSPSSGDVTPIKDSALGLHAPNGSINMTPVAAAYNARENQRQQFLEVVGCDCHDLLSRDRS